MPYRFVRRVGKSEWTQRRRAFLYFIWSSIHCNTHREFQKYIFNRELSRSENKISKKMETNSFHAVLCLRYADAVTHIHVSAPHIRIAFVVSAYESIVRRKRKRFVFYHAVPHVSGKTLQRQRHSFSRVFDRWIRKEERKKHFLGECATEIRKKYAKITRMPDSKSKNYRFECLPHANWWRCRSTDANVNEFDVLHVVFCFASALRALIWLEFSRNNSLADALKTQVTHLSQR